MLKTVKVSIDKLDLLLNNVGELVIANSGFTGFMKSSEIFWKQICHNRV